MLSYSGKPQSFQVNLANFAPKETFNYPYYSGRKQSASVLKGNTISIFQGCLLHNHL